ncbi:excisionase family DNA binding protein [Clostridium saccharoperbutylacetonicum]|jgi:excisionase family DNA binding protein|uniref:DNA binding domain protein, excisionase family n=1 Tax=Clostridium saccharoperbutylacetonicum N1-4(HMT) TaxID=931276 RepID=M1LS63_9CLOT|nr:helix-turn-helix domain-containing protein [Clostridium saccharoperbutylacetonicum]AGF55770.1 DNA binding domain protein, excisionase family [Clostridium saccharoperbutylacetonicum N1-4(HMT)]NRT63497.1 excisionase family DNA binding protein [Clostridium saccharoperbutylacetonicum]NSB26859.1 excisionase family DNA binding protein [Clostridium saccharoperbutylacetonicum]NSB40341.1 excisionase family DNA binding protein [Clostridium saccharoperbutylacetonicum]
MENQFYTIDKIAEILGMHHKTIRKFITEGKLAASKVGKQWRISGHDLSLFMEKNNVNINDKNITEESNIDFITNGEVKVTEKQKINVSTVVDINDVDKDEYFRISNTLIAVMNCKDPKMGKSTINMKYDEKENRLRVLLWGTVSFIEEMLKSISMLVEQRDL